MSDDERDFKIPVPRMPDWGSFVPKSGVLSSTEALRGVRSPLVELAEANTAAEFYKRLTRWIQDFDAGLDEEHEVGARLVSFGQAVTFSLRDIGYWNPSLISFRGVSDGGDPVELIQHVSQISVLLVKLPRPDPSVPKIRIGFHDDPTEE